MTVKMKLSLSLQVDNNEKETYVIQEFVGQKEQAIKLIEAAVTWSKWTIDHPKPKQ